MSHQDRPCPLVINHQTLKQVIDWLLAPAVFASLRGRKQATWKPRLLAATALLWATSELSTLHERFAQARKIIAKVFRWQLAPGVSYQGFVKRLGKWQDELLAAVVPHLREQRQAVHQKPGHFGRWSLQSPPAARSASVLLRWPESPVPFAALRAGHEAGASGTALGGASGYTRDGWDRRHNPECENARQTTDPDSAHAVPATAGTIALQGSALAAGPNRRRIGRGYKPLAPWFAIPLWDAWDRPT
jgi:hypothetical protein